MRSFLLAVLIPVLGLAPPSESQQAFPEVDAALASARVRASAGDAVAQFSLGSLLYYGTEHTAEAIDWFRKAAAQKYAAAEFQLGQLYDFGFGVTQNDREALEWYRRAAEQGSPAAERSVADFYRKGRAVALDPAEAARWYLRAAEGDDVRAQFHLGELYLSGTGVARNEASAYFWFSVAASQTPLEDNRKQLIELRNVAAARMTAAEVKDASSRVAAWKPARRRS